MWVTPGEEVAIKLIKRPIPKPALAVIKREIKIQADLGQGHMNIVSADEVVLSKTHLGLVMEYVPGLCLPLWGAGCIGGPMRMERCMHEDRRGLNKACSWRVGKGGNWPEALHSSPLGDLLTAGGNMVQFVTKKRETKHTRGGLCIDEDEARFYFLQVSVNRLQALESC